MRVFTDIHNLKTEVSNAVVTLGTFDGVHLGHRKVLDELKRVSADYNKSALVITYWPHPRIVLSNSDDTPKLLSTLENKIVLFEQMGIENLLVLAFSKQLAEKSHDEFVSELLINQLNVHSVVVGYDHRFGKDRKGSFDFLKHNSKEFKINVFEVGPYELNDIAVSSTKIRKALAEGELDTANAMLGYHYFIEGRVVKGWRLASKLSFPTANLALDNYEQQMPKDGVYLVRVEFEEDNYYGILNTGENPTIPLKGRSIEVHIFEFNKNIYDKNVAVHFIKRIRDEMRFENTAQLQQQIENDKQLSLEIISQLK